jgi:hypothetical protein
METAWVAIAVAVIGGPLMWFLSRLDKRNTEQHASSFSVLQETRAIVESLDTSVDRLEAKVDTLDNRVFEHIAFHAEKPDSAS